jgi:hypothetical protein
LLFRYWIMTLSTWSNWIVSSGTGDKLIGVFSMGLVELILRDRLKYECEKPGDALWVAMLVHPHQVAREGSHVRHPRG